MLVMPGLLAEIAVRFWPSASARAFHVEQVSVRCGDSGLRQGGKRRLWCMVGRPNSQFGLDGQRQSVRFTWNIRLYCGGFLPARRTMKDGSSDFIRLAEVVALCFSLGAMRRFTWNADWHDVEFLAAAGTMNGDQHGFRCI